MKYWVIQRDTLLQLCYVVTELLECILNSGPTGCSNNIFHSRPLGINRLLVYRAMLIVSNAFKLLLGVAVKVSGPLFGPK